MTTTTQFRCVSDAYDPSGEEPYASVAEFLAMCRRCFGEAPELRRDGDEYYDEEGRLVLEAIEVDDEDALERAIEYLHAEPMEDGRYRYYSDGTRSHWAVSRESVISLGRALAAQRADAYSLWCAEEGAEELVESA